MKLQVNWLITDTNKQLEADQIATRTQSVMGLATDLASDVQQKVKSNLFSEAAIIEENIDNDEEHHINDSQA